MAERGNKKKVYLQSGGRMLLGLSDETQNIPYVARENVLENVPTMLTLFEYFHMMATLKIFLQKKGFKGHLW